MDKESSVPPPRHKESPPDNAFVYTPALERFAGAAVDVIFLHIILIPLRTPAADLSFQYGTVLPAALFTTLYFAFLLLILRFRGLTPGGLPLKYRVVDGQLRHLSWTASLRRLAPYVIIQLIGLWRLQVVLGNFAESGDEYVFDDMYEIVEQHGGFWNVVVVALNSFVLMDLLLIIPSPRNQSLSDRIAASVVVTRKTSLSEG